MRVTVPHKLSRDDVRERLRMHAHEIAGNVPGAEVNTSWAGADRMDLTVSAMGQKLQGAIDIEDDQLVIELDLPFALSFVEPMIAGQIREQGQKLLA